MLLISFAQEKMFLCWYAHYSILISMFYVFIYFLSIKTTNCDDIIIVKFFVFFVLIVVFTARTFSQIPLPTKTLLCKLLVAYWFTLRGLNRDHGRER